MNDERFSPFHVRNCSLHELRTNNAFRLFTSCLKEQLEVYRAEYEENEASEFTRGKVQAIKTLLNELAQQNIK